MVLIVNLTVIFFAFKDAKAFLYYKLLHNVLSWHNNYLIYLEPGTRLVYTHCTCFVQLTNAPYVSIMSLVHIFHPQRKKLKGWAKGYRLHYLNSYGYLIVGPAQCFPNKE